MNNSGIIVKSSVANALKLFTSARNRLFTSSESAEELRAQLEQIVREPVALREAVSGTQSAFESHDKFLRDRYLNPAQPAEVGIEDDVAEQRRRSLRCALGEAQLALAEFEKKHDVKAVEAELADIDRLAGACPANADASHPAHLKR